MRLQIYDIIFYMFQETAGMRHQWQKYNYIITWLFLGLKSSSTLKLFFWHPNIIFWQYKCLNFHLKQFSQFSDADK